MSSEISTILKAFAEVTSSPAPVIALEGVQEGVARLRVEFWVPAGVGVTFTPQVVEALQAKYPHADVNVVRTA
jgi:hypothetical protein